MAVDYKPLNRNQEFTTAQKAALKKVFAAMYQMCINSDVSYCTRKFVHRALAAHFSGLVYDDIFVLYDYILENMLALDNSNTSETVVGTFRMSSEQKKIIRVMADAVLVDIST